MLSKYRKIVQVGASLSTIGIAVALAGCGGTTTTNNGIRNTIPTTPTAYGLSATFLELGGVSEEVSGLESADESVLYATAATSSTAVPINTIQGATGTIPLGFSSGAVFQNSSKDNPNIGQAFVPGISNPSVRFRVTLSNGSDVNGTTYQINPNAVTLTSPDLPGQVIPLSFSPNTATTYGLANATYVTAPFTLPASLTTGLHTFTISVSDTKPQTTTTTYEVVVVRSTDSATLVLTTPGSAVSITNPLAGTVNPAIGDEQGEAVLFSSPGTQTVTGPTPKTGPANTQNVVLVGGQLTIADSAAL